MNREELLKVAKAASFTGPLALKIMAGEKTMTSRPIAPLSDIAGNPILNPSDWGQMESVFTKGVRIVPVFNHVIDDIVYEAKWPRGIYPVDTICWVREPGKAQKWLEDGTNLGNKRDCLFHDESTHGRGEHIVAATKDGQGFSNGIPRVFARTFYKVISRSVYKLTDITLPMAQKEGFETTGKFFSAWDKIYSKRGMSTAEKWHGIVASNEFVLIHP